MKRSAHRAWLFTFIDIAFLLLLVFTQFARMGGAHQPVAEMRLPAPVVEKSPEQTPLSPGRDYCQVLVEAHCDKPFLLTRIKGGVERSRSAAMSYDRLKAALAALEGNDSSEPRPVVVPLPKSYSSDLLQATALVSDLWNQGGRAVVHTAP